MPNLRKNIITGEWVVIAPERAKRPEDFISGKKQEAKNETDKCPFCIPGPAYETKIFETKNIYTIPNKFPSFIPEDAVLEQGGPLYPSYRGLGYHEVVNLKDHYLDLEDMSISIWDELLYVYQQRIKEHIKDPAIEYSLVIHNKGPDAGASIIHPHSQIFASSVLPTRVEKELKGSKQYFAKHKKCVFCDLVQSEIEKKQRVILENEDYVAFCFFAARFPFETWIMPKKHQSFFEKIGKSERIGLAKILLSFFKILDKKLNNPDYNFFIHTAPPRFEDTELDSFFHWHLEVMPRLSKMGGYELGADVFVDVVSPESAAYFLRQNH